MVGLCTPTNTRLKQYVINRREMEARIGAGSAFEGPHNKEALLPSALKATTAWAIPSTPLA
jgi:hypothetical protein